MAIAAAPALASARALPAIHAAIRVRAAAVEITAVHAAATRARGIGPGF